MRGASSAADAPPLTAGQDYQDTLAKGQVRFYAVRLPATGTAAAPATAYLSAFAVPGAGSHVGVFDGLDLQLLAGNGTLCGSDHPRFTGPDTAAPVGGVVRRPGTAGSVCREAGTYLLSVARVSAVPSSADVWPLDVSYAAEPALTSAPTASGGAAVPGYAPATAAPPTGAGHPVDGAAGMDGTGTRLSGTGVYTDHLVPGQTRFYRVPVGWGQRLLADAAFGRADVTRPGGFTVGALSVALYSPVRGAVAQETMPYTGQATTLDAQTPRVLYDNRLANDTRVSSAAVAGYYYLAVGLHPDVARWTSGGVDVTLRLRVLGSQQAAPDYAGDAAAAGLTVPHAPGPTAGGSGGGGGTAPGTAPAATGAAAGATGPAAARPVAYGAFGLAAVFTVWPTVLLLRGRRRPVRP
ncbi:hypothetical protein [Streptantibioticus silvisoli]|uniref:Uncharacterized protein n=1 Tax=Streptantibioticus silvisoli TaxID=2705255 RepID=A0ABT6W0Q3_9ACTN|nr:hypothetical protein [Streptantibioticus silvisoli]MDI5964328.1 hypothetical protein [Streptantibioticus silvisoli]